MRRYSAKRGGPATPLTYMRESFEQMLEIIFCNALLLGNLPSRAAQVSYRLKRSRPTSLFRFHRSYENIAVQIPCKGIYRQPKSRSFDRPDLTCMQIFIES